MEDGKEEEGEEEEYTSVSEDADNRSLKNTGKYLQTYSMLCSVQNFLLQFVDKLPFIDWRMSHLQLQPVTEPYSCLPTVGVCHAIVHGFTLTLYTLS